VLIEPALTTVPAAAATLAGLSGVMRAYEGGDRAAAVDRFLTAFAGEGCGAGFDACLPPGWREQALAEAPIYFEGELPAALRWPFDRAAAASVPVPVLLVHGAETNSIFVETAVLLHSWLPDARVAPIPGASHFSPTFAADAVAREVRAFVASLQGGGIAPTAASGGVRGV
jgi:pimeloyl-ACP methyl ester carboxylesterase